MVNPDFIQGLVNEIPMRFPLSTGWMCRGSQSRWKFTIAIRSLDQHSICFFELWLHNNIIPSGDNHASPLKSWWIKDPAHELRGWQAHREGSNDSWFWVIGQHHFGSFCKKMGHLGLGFLGISWELGLYLLRKTANLRTTLLAANPKLVRFYGIPVVGLGWPQGNMSWNWKLCE